MIGNPTSDFRKGFTDGLQRKYDGKIGSAKEKYLISEIRFY